MTQPHSVKGQTLSIADNLSVGSITTDGAGKKLMR